MVRENLTRGSLEYTEFWEVAQRLTERLPGGRSEGVVRGALTHRRKRGTGRVATDRTVSALIR